MLLCLQALTAPTLLQFFTIKMQEGIVATSYANGDKFYIDPMKLLPLDRFLPKPKGAGVQKGGGSALSFCRCCIKSYDAACYGCQAAHVVARD